MSTEETEQAPAEVSAEEIITLDALARRDQKRRQWAIEVAKESYADTACTTHDLVSRADAFEKFVVNGDVPPPPPSGQKPKPQLKTVL